MRPLPGRLVLLGHPVGHSLSPHFQNAALRAAAIPLVYEALDVPPARLPSTLAELARVRAAGNITIPHKRAVAAACAHLTPQAERVGAVNTFWHDGEALVGDNTDVAGFDALVRSVLGQLPATACVVMLGAGGAAAAVCAAVAAWRDARLTVVGRTPERVDALRRRFPEIHTMAASPGLADASAVLAEADVVVNATPVGMTSDTHPIPLTHLRRDAAVMDLVYRPGETAWVRAARAAGHPAADGLEMLIAQGAHAFERWFGVPPDVACMRAALAA